MALKLRINEFKRLIDAKADAFLKAITVALHEYAQHNADKINTGVVVPITRPRAGGNATQRTIYPDSSKPGESPRRRTGFGRDNIVWGYRRSLQEGRVGYTKNARYMLFHELGIRFRKVGFQRRPTIIPSLRDNRFRLVELGRRAAAEVRR